MNYVINVYQNWIETNFPNIQQISYEDMLMNGDVVMEDLTGDKNTFTNQFGITLNSIIKKEYSFLQSIAKNESADHLSKEEARGLARYRLTSKDMINKDILFNLPFAFIAAIPCSILWSETCPAVKVRQV